MDALPFLLSLTCLGCSAGAASSAGPTGMAGRLIQQLKLEKIPDEGCWFALTYRSADPVTEAALPERYRGTPHVAGSAIYALETKDDFSALHRVQTDELWHFYGGHPLEMLLLFPDGHGESRVLGPDVFQGQQPQLVVPRGVWQGSRPLGTEPDRYTWFGNTLAPGFEVTDFEIGYRDELQLRYPQFAGLIAELTREEFRTRPAPNPAPRDP